MRNVFLLPVLQDFTNIRGDITMPKNNNAIPQDALQIQREPVQHNNMQMQQNKHLTYQTTAIDRHLGTLSSYNYLPEDQKEELRDFQNKYVSLTNLERNQTLIKQVYAGVPTSVAYTYAEASYKPLEVPAKETYKQKKERKRQEKLAKEQNPGADHYSYGIVHSLQRMKDNLNNSIEAIPEDVKEQIINNQVDTRVIRCYCNGFKVKENGEPASWSDKNVKDVDMEFCQAYASKDIEKRREFLDDIMSQLLSKELSMDMFSYNYLKDHAGEVRLMCTRFTYFKNIYEDPVNKPYFDEKSPRIKELIKVRILDQIEPLNHALVSLIGSKAVNMNEADYIRSDGYSIYCNALNQSIENLSNSLKIRDEKTTKIFDLDGELEEGVVKSELPAYVKLENCKQLMNSNPAQYKKHMGIIDKIYKDLLVSADTCAHLSFTSNKSFNFKKQPSDEIGTERMLAFSTATKIMDKCKFNLKIHQHYVDTNINVIEHLLTKTKLTPEGKVLLNNLQKEQL